MIKLVGTRKNRTLRVIWLLEELGIEYEHVPASPRSDEVKKIVPSGKVPALIVDGTIISDSVAIMTYLADKHGQFTFPAGTVDRAIQDSHTQFLCDEFDACLWAAARHTFILPEEKRVPDVKESLKWEFERSLGLFMDRLGDGPYLMGDTMTIADIVACHLGNWAVNARFPVDNQPRFLTYTDRLRERPAYKRAMEKD